MQQFLTGNKCEQTEESIVLLTLGRQDFTRITACGLDPVQWKHLQIALLLCQHFKNVAFIFAKTVTETALETNN